jgi:outer membrane immunogenic protein
MKNLLRRSVGLMVLLASPVMAADIAVKTPTPVPVPVYSWTGFYVGGNIGYSWGDSHTDLSGSVNVISFPGTASQFINAPIPFASSSSQRLNGVIGGGQIGLNYQFSPQWVLGFEFDLQGSGERGSGTFVDPVSGSICISVITPCATFLSGTGTLTTSYDAKIDWFGTARGRLGYLITDQVLLYATGGVAYGHVELSGITTFNIPVPGPIAPAPAAFSESKTNAGWAAGGGVEGKFAYWLPSNWTWKLEYLYVDLGSLDTATPGAIPSTAPGLGNRSSFGTVTTRTHFTDNIVRVGLNYQFH